MDDTLKLAVAGVIVAIGGVFATVYTTEIKDKICEVTDSLCTDRFGKVRWDLATERQHSRGDPVATAPNPYNDPLVASTDTFADFNIYRTDILTGGRRDPEFCVPRADFERYRLAREPGEIFRINNDSENVAVSALPPESLLWVLVKIDTLPPHSEVRAYINASYYDHDDDKSMFDRSLQIIINPGAPSLDLACMIADPTAQDLRDALGGHAQYGGPRPRNVDVTLSLTDGILRAKPFTVLHVATTVTQ